MTALCAQDLPLVDLILDANYHEDGWHKLLDRLRTHFNLKSSNLYLVDFKNFTMFFQDTSGEMLPPAALQEYAVKFYPIDPVHRVMLSSPACTWVTSNFEPYRTQLTSMPEHLEWVKKYDVPYTTGCVLYRKGTSVCAMMFQRSYELGEFSVEEEERFSAISQYIAKAINVRIRMLMAAKDDVRLSSVLNAIKLPVAATNEFGEVIAQNRLMTDLLASQNYLSKDEHSRLVLKNADANRLLNYSVIQSVSKAKSNEVGYVTDIIECNAEKGSAPFYIGTSELIERSDDNGEVFAGSMIYVASSKFVKPVDEDQLISLFGLTPAEARSCSLFSANLSLKEIARQEDKSVNTVREQIQNAYVKTGVRNQIELINLLASLPAKLPA